MNINTFNHHSLPEENTIYSNSLDQSEEKVFNNLMIQIKNRRSSLSSFLTENPQIKTLNDDYRLEILKTLAGSKIDDRDLDTFIDLMDECSLDSVEERGEIGTILALKDNVCFVKQLYNKFNKLKIEDERVKLELAINVANSRSSVALGFLAENLSKLNLSYASRLKLAEAHAAFPDKIESLVGQIHPLQLVINNIKEFDLEENDRIEFTHKWLERYDPKSWSLVAYQIDRIAPSNVIERIAIAKRFIDANDDKVLSQLVKNITKFDLPEEFVKELFSIIRERNEQHSLTALIKQVEHFSLDKAESREIVDMALNIGDDYTLSSLVEAIDKLQQPLEELPRIACLITEKGEDYALIRLVNFIAKFQLTVDQELDIFTKVARKEFKEDSRTLFFILVYLSEYKFPENSHEPEKILLLNTFVENVTEKSISTLINYFEKFKISDESDRKNIVEKIAVKTTYETFYNFKLYFKKFELSENSTVEILNSLAERHDAALSSDLCRNMRQFKVKGESKLSERVKLALTLLHVYNSAWGREVKYLNIVNEDIANADHKVPNAANYVVKAIKSLGLGSEVLQFLPELFPEEIINLFSEEISLVESLVNKTKEENRELVGHQLFTLLVCLMQQTKLNHISPQEIESTRTLIHELCTFKNPAMRMDLFVKMNNRLFGKKNAAIMNSWKELSQNIKNKRAILHASCLIIYIMKDPNSMYEVSKIIELIQSDKKFIKDYRNREALLSFMNTIFNRAHLKAPEMYKLLTTIFEIKNRKERRKALAMIETMALACIKDDLKKIENPDEIEQLFERLFFELFEVEKIEGFKDKYLNTISKFRKSFTLLTYAGQINRLKFSEQENVKTQYREYFLSILNENFPDMRYDKNSSLHLATIFDDRNDLEKEWRKGECIDAGALSHPLQNNNNNEGDCIDLDTFFKDKIVNHRHLGNNQERKYPNLLQGLQVSFEERKQLIDEITNQISIDKSRLDNTSEVDGRNTIGQRLLSLKFEKEALVLSMEKLEQKELIGRLNTINTSSIKETQLFSDINELKNRQKKKIIQSTLTVVDTDNPNDLLLMGTEIQQSCQSIPGHPDFNKCLVGYLVDGKNRMIAVKNDRGELIGRCVLRILWDGNKPVLYRERFYVNNGNKTVQNLLEQMCLRRAKTLDLTLLTGGCENNTYQPYENKVQSLGSRAPFEYVDAETETDEHIVENGIFTLKNPVILYLPDK